MDRKIYEERKSAREEQYRRDERIRRLADKYHTDDDPFEVYEALAKEIEEAEAASDKARENQAFWEKVVGIGDTVQTACDCGVGMIAAVTGPVGKTIQGAYIVGKSTLGRSSEALMARKQGLEGAAAGALKGLGVGVLEAATNLMPINTNTLTGAAVTTFTKSFGTTLTTILNGRMDGKSKEDVKEDVINASMVQVVSMGIGSALGEINMGNSSVLTPNEYKNTVLTLGGKDLISAEFSGTISDFGSAAFEGIATIIDRGLSGLEEMGGALGID